jgi:hypothetical protein
MSILTMNLKQLYQRRGLWLAYGMFGLFVWVSVIFALDTQAAGEGKFIGLIALAFLIGMTAAVLQMEILTKPMAFCLPGHRQSVRKFIFSIGVVTNGASALLFLLYPGLPFAWRLLVLCSAFFAGLVFFLAGAVLAFRFQRTSDFTSLLALGISGVVLLKLHIPLEQIVVLHPLVVMGFGLLCAAGVWVYLNNADLARRHCLRPWVGFDELFNREKLRRSPRKRDAAPWAKLKDHPRPWVEEFFISRMTQCEPLSPARFAWGAVYSSFAIVISQWKYPVSLALFFGIFLGYWGPRMSMMPAFFLPFVIMGMYASQPTVYSAMLIAAGRKERFFSTLAVMASGAGLLVVFLAGVSILSVPLASVMPDIKFHGLNVSYGTIGIEAIYISLAFLPLASAVQLLLYRRPLLMMVAVAILACLLAPIFIFLQSSSGAFVRLIWRDGLTSSARLAAIVVGLTLCWLVFVTVLRHIAAKRCLIR